MLNSKKQAISQTIASGDFIVMVVEKEYELILQKIEPRNPDVMRNANNPNNLILGYPGKGFAYHPGDFDHCKSIEEIKAQFLRLHHELPDERQIKEIIEDYHLNFSNNKSDAAADKTLAPQD